jgi:hypothetical protein
MLAVPTMATAGPRASAGKMPGQNWIYVLFTLMGSLFAVGVFATVVPQVAYLWALGGLPSFAGAPRGGGAVYRGVLEGAAEVTPLGGAAVAWIGIVTRSTRQGKGSYTAEKCRLGHVSDLHLAGDGRRWSIQALELNDVSLRPGFGPARGPQTRYWLGPTEKVSPVPDDIIARCQIAAGDLGRGEWAYTEQAVAPGSSAEFAGCAEGDVLFACRAPGSVARGHLSVPGMRAMARRMADAAMRLVALGAGLTLFFTAFGAIAALLALRAAAPVAVARPKQRT